MTAVSYALFALFPIGMAYAAASDLLTMTIPNRLNLALLAAFAVAAPFAGLGWSDIGLHLAAGATVLVLGFGCFALGWVGGGDAKFAAVAALWLGFPQALFFVAYGAVIGGALTLVLLSFRSGLLPAFALRQAWIMRLHDPKVGVPYGIALAAAGLLVYPQTVWMGLAS